MISAQEWWGVLQDYQRTIFPAQVLLYLLGGIILIWFLRSKSEAAGRWIKAYFAVCFGWIGFVFFLICGGRLPAHAAQSVLFLSLTALFTVDLAAGITRFSLSAAGWRRMALWIGIGLAMIGYPLAGLLHEHPLSKWLIPGSFPCPTTGPGAGLYGECISGTSAPVALGHVRIAAAVGYSVSTPDPNPEIRRIRGRNHGGGGSVCAGRPDRSRPPGLRNRAGSRPAAVDGGHHRFSAGSERKAADGLPFFFRPCRILP